MITIEEVSKSIVELEEENEELRKRLEKEDGLFFLGLFFLGLFCGVLLGFVIYC